jgi:Domain of unknown function (DUF6434)
MPYSINWHSHPLTNDTVITKSFKMTQNVRRFFAAQLGHEVKFKRDFLLWMKASSGITLEEAVEKYRKTV